MRTLELVLTFIVAFSLGILLTVIHSMLKESKRVKFKKFIDFFGIRMEENEFLSLVSSMISYLVVDENNELDLSKFLDVSRLRFNRYKDSFYILEGGINLFPLVSCKYIGDYKYKVDIDETVKKVEEYQKCTGMDDYILPLISVALIEKYPTLFNYPTRAQEYATKSNILKDEIFGDNFKTVKEIAISNNGVAQA